MRKKEIIQVPPENVMKIANVVKVAKITVYNALAFRSDSETAQVIRNLAIRDYGGVKTYKLIM